jgi:hypothetical protein
MPSDTPTDTLWPPPLPAIGVLALRVLQVKIGDPAWREDPPGSNQGEVVRWACERWLSPEGFAEEYQRGRLAWCAGAVCSALVEAGSIEIRAVASLSCEALWARLRERGWTVEPGQEQAGDLYFLGGPDKLRHVGFVEVPG